LSDHKAAGNGDSDTSLNDFKTRRRLLKASAAAPLIATLVPGTALAQASISCAQKSEDYVPLQGLPPATAADDSAVRREGILWTHDTDTDKNIYEVGGQFYQVKNLSSTSAPNSDYTSSPHFFVEYYTVSPVDGSISSVGTYPATMQGTLVADSCWTSIVGINAVNINP
jgi:hypothetical protein